MFLGQLGEVRGVRGRQWAIGLVVAVLALLLNRQTMAQQPLPLEAVPPELRPWIPWVQDGLGGTRCPEVGAEHQCFWPGELSLDVSDRGASFRLRVLVDRESSVPLPGSKEHWPEDVQLSGAPVVVLGDATPGVTLPSGNHELTGRFLWETTPESLTIPPSVALVSLRLRGQDLPQATRDKSDSVWLGRSEAANSGEPETAEVEVFRRLGDGVPFHIDTHIVIRVSGRARELALGRPLIAGSRPTELTAQIPVRLDEQGVLFAQVRAGEHIVKLGAVLPTPTAKLVRPKQPAPWPEQEIWVWAPAPNLRQVQVSGLMGIDPTRTNLPAEWRPLSAYIAEADGALDFNTVQRGQAVAPPNSVTLTRNLWWDADGGGFTARDRIRGQMNREWRLDLKTGELGHVKFASDDQLITLGPTGHPGIEIRTGALDLLAEWRQSTTNGNTIPAAGWSENLEAAAIRLHLPTGWRFLGAWGVDEAQGSWMEEWNLLGLGYVLGVALAIARLTRWYWGILAGLALALSHEYATAPYAIWGVVVVLLASLRLVNGTWSRAAVGMTGAVAVFILVGNTLTFLGKQLTVVAAPDSATEQVMREGYTVGSFGNSTMDRNDEDLLAPGATNTVSQALETNLQGGGAQSKGDQAVQNFQNAQQDASQGVSPQRTLKRSSGRGSWGPAVKKNSLQQQLDLNAVVQTGPGIPDWEGSQHLLRWRGPVQQDATLRLFLLNPWQNGLLGLLRALALGSLTWVLVKSLVCAFVSAPAQRSGGRVPPSAALFIGVILAGLTTSTKAVADVPSDAILAELGNRLNRTPNCGDACLTVPSLALGVRGSTLTLDVEVHVGKATAYPIPGPATSWVPRSITVDDKPSSAVILRDDGYLHLRLEPGRHRVVLEGPLGTNDLTLAMSTPARHVAVTADGWDVDGVRDGHVEGSLHLARKATAGATAGQEAERARATLPPWLEIQRTLEIGVTWKIRTGVMRISKAPEPLAIRFPLLPGEEVTESTLVAEHGAVLLSLGRDQEALEFTSVLKPSAGLTLVAAQGQPWSEIWTLECGAVWHCQASGIAPEQHQSNGTFQPQFRPWPGERVSVKFSRPSAAPGVSTTVDGATLRVTPETSASSLTLRIRTSAGGVHALSLPPDAMVMTLTVGDKAQPIQLLNGKLNVVLKPGEQTVKVEFRHTGAKGMALTAPPVRVGPAVNAHTTIVVPQDQFVVWAQGPGRGGRVLLWGLIAIYMVAALGLSLVPFNPIKRWQWALLGFGFTLIPWGWLIPIVGWIFLVGWRASWTGPATWRKNLAQAALALVTLVAAGVVLGTLEVALSEAPQVMIFGEGSTRQELHFVVDRVLADAALPEPWVLTAPLWVWRVVYLVWAFGLAWVLWGVGRFAWAAFSKDGVLGPWRPARAATVTPATVTPATVTPATVATATEISPGKAVPQEDAAEE